VTRAHAFADGVSVLTAWSQPVERRESPRSGEIGITRAAGWFALDTSSPWARAVSTHQRGEPGRRILGPRRAMRLTSPPQRWRPVDGHQTMEEIEQFLFAGGITEAEPNFGFGGAGHHVGPCAAADAADVDGRVAVVGASRRTSCKRSINFVDGGDAF